MGRKVVTSERVFETCWIKYCWVNNEYFLGFDDYLTATFVDCNNPCESWRRKSKEQKTQSHKCLKDLTRYNFQGWNDNDDLKRRQKNDANDAEKTTLEHGASKQESTATQRLWRRQRRRRRRRVCQRRRSRKILRCRRWPPWCRRSTRCRRAGRCRESPTRSGSEWVRAPVSEGCNKIASV